jgi:DNA processing protein
MRLGIFSKGINKINASDFENVPCLPQGNSLSSRTDTREAFIALNMIEGVGPIRARSLLERFGDAPRILAASKSELLRVHNLGDDTAERVASWEKSVGLADELKRISDFGCHVLISSDENYPPLLREIYDPPLVNGVPIWQTSPIIGL